MGGAATICSTIVSAAKLSLPVNVIGEWEAEYILEARQTVELKQQHGVLKLEKIRSCLAEVFLSVLMELNVFCNHGL